MEHEDEEWRTVAGHPDYEVSDRGRVRRITTRHGKQRAVGRLLRPSSTAEGYRRVVLYIKGKRRAWLVHRLVCTAFHGPPPSPKHHAAHWDNHPSNNRADNLRWATAAENQADRERHGTVLRGSDNHRATAKLTEADVRRIRQLHREGVPLRDITRQYSSVVTRACVWQIIKGKTWKWLDAAPQIRWWLTRPSANSYADLYW